MKNFISELPLKMLLLVVISALLAVATSQESGPIVSTLSGDVQGRVMYYADGL